MFYLYMVKVLQLLHFISVNWYLFKLYKTISCCLFIKSYLMLFLNYKFFSFHWLSDFGAFSILIINYINKLLCFCCILWQFDLVLFFYFFLLVFKIVYLKIRWTIFLFYFIIIYLQAINLILELLHLLLHLLSFLRIFLTFLLKFFTICHICL
jgi:hypothetical protein